MIGGNKLVHFGRIMTAEDGRIEARERPHGRAFGAHTVPELAPCDTDRSDGANSRDDDSTTHD
jgi:hypothetical protein